MSSAREQERNTRKNKKYSTPPGLGYREDKESKKGQKNGGLAKYWLILAVTFLITFFFAVITQDARWARWNWKQLIFLMLLIADFSGLALLLSFQLRKIFKKG